ncbi:MAG: hypothetical protein ACOX31_00080 [Eubacteriales bacterium]
MRNLAYEQMTEYVPVAPGEYNVQVYPAGQTEEPLVNTVLTAPPERRYLRRRDRCFPLHSPAKIKGVPSLGQTGQPTSLNPEDTFGFELRRLIGITARSNPRALRSKS